ncbi:MAG: LOG family protein [Hyphomicrobiales bacterium]
MTKGSVVVFGSSQAARNSPHYRLGHDLGAALARLGAVVRCGGYGGVMEAVAAGAKTAGGKVVGCTLSWFDETRVPNTHLDEVHDSPDLESRVRCLLTGARGAIVLPGGVGTMNELFWVWNLLLFDRDDGPESLVLLGEHWAELLEFLTKRFEFGPPVRSLVQVASTAEEAAGIAWGTGT